MKEAMQNQGTPQAGGEGDDLPSWNEIAQAYDKASASWLQVYGEKSFLQARPWAEKAAGAMKKMGWLVPKTQVVIAMLDGRGDEAQFEGDNCRVQINIDEHASSPVIRALGSYGSSLSFIAAHELAHCRYDVLPLSERLPTLEMIRQSGASEKLSIRIMEILTSPSNLNGDQDLVDAYDEALADAAAAVALRADEESAGNTSRYGSAISLAESVRFGAIAQSIRRRVPAEVHQGAFTFSAVTALKPNQLNWEQARKIAFQSVLASSLMMKEKNRWFKDLVLSHPVDAVILAQRWGKKAKAIIAKRNLDLDEDRYRSASSPAIFAFSPTDGKGAYQDSPEMAMARWKKIAWIVYGESPSSMQ